MAMKKIATLTGAMAATLLASSVPANAASFTTITGYQCPTAKCVDFASAGYTVSGGAVTSNSVKNQQLTPGSDVKGPDAFNDASKVTSYNITSELNKPVGALNDILVSGLENSFEFFWGSVDTYNVVEFYNGTSKVKTVTGSDIAALAGVSTKPNGNFGFDAYVKFGDGTTLFDNVKLLTNKVGGSGIAFEVAAAAKTPEPATLLGLTAVGLIAGSTLRKRKQQEAEA